VRFQIPTCFKTVDFRPETRHRLKERRESLVPVKFEKLLRRDDPMNFRFQLNLDTKGRIVDLEYGRVIAAAVLSALLFGCSTSPAPIEVRVNESGDGLYVVEIQSKEDGVEIEAIEVNRGQCNPKYARNRGQRPPPYTLNYLESRQTNWLRRQNPVREVKIATNKGASVISF
jgi:hypothetical protein